MRGQQTNPTTNQQPEVEAAAVAPNNPASNPGIEAAAVAPSNPASNRGIEAAALAPNPTTNRVTISPHLDGNSGSIYIGPRKFSNYSNNSE
jgi:hypothetical protein